MDRIYSNTSTVLAMRLLGAVPHVLAAWDLMTVDDRAVTAFAKRRLAKIVPPLVSGQDVDPGTVYLKGRNELFIWDRDQITGDPVYRAFVIPEDLEPPPWLTFEEAEALEGDRAWEVDRARHVQQALTLTARYVARVVAAAVANADEAIAAYNDRYPLFPVDSRESFKIAVHDHCLKTLISGYTTGQRYAHEPGVWLTWDMSRVIVCQDAGDRLISGCAFVPYTTLEKE